MSTSSNPPSGNTRSIDEELEKMWKQILDETDYCANSAPMKSRPNQDLEPTNFLQANVNRMLNECSELEWTPGDRVNFNQCKRLQCEFEGVMEERRSNCFSVRTKRKANNIPQEQGSSRKHQQSLPSQDAGPSVPVGKRQKRTLSTNHSPQPQSSQEPSNSPAPVSLSPPLQNNIRHSIAPIPNDEQISPAAASATRSIYLARAAAHVRLAKAELLGLQRATTNIVFHLSQVETRLRLAQNEEADNSFEANELE
ncbi:hypothetical protein EDD16DRAFT_1703611 [Pisolithus croceorrhizus]|nr:hypothetical protein EDD16DRAFT_1703611 [Pisolithus croceorrhizus]